MRWMSSTFCLVTPCKLVLQACFSTLTQFLNHTFLVGGKQTRVVGALEIAFLLGAVL